MKYLLEEANEQIYEFNEPSITDEPRLVTYVGPGEVDATGEPWAYQFVDVDGPYTHWVDARNILVGLIMHNNYIYHRKEIKNT